MLDEQIQKDYVQAMKDRNAVRSSTISFLRAQLKNVKIDQKKEQLADADVVAVIKKQVKQRQDSIAQYTQGGRKDLAEKETQELDILKSYLPQELGEAELQGIVKQIIQESGASSIKDMGKVMKLTQDKVSGRADNKLVSEIVKKSLGG